MLGYPGLPVPVPLVEAAEHRGIILAFYPAAPGVIIGVPKNYFDVVEILRRSTRIEALGFHFYRI